MKERIAELGAIGIGDIAEALVGAFLWRWFIVPLGVPAVSVLHMMALIMMLRWLWPEKADPTVWAFDRLADRLAKSVATVAVGAIIHFTMDVGI
ncbi:MAG: hypothetical protein JSR47_24855 [Proteobacteria bacterium]|nr:hypothetical protein [Pseudomonadota bacterium]